MRLLRLIRLVPAVAILCCLSAGLQSCHKKKHGSTVSNVTYDFSVSGNTLIGYNVSFQSTAPATSSFLWNFGDGTTSTDAAPVHVYSQGDSFKVTLIVDRQTSKTITKTIFIATPPDAFIVTGIAGMKYWHGYIIAHFQSPSARDTISTLTDQFEISVINSTTISLKNDVLGCYYTDPVSHIYYFRYLISQYSWREIAYNYSTGSIRYIYYPDQGGDPNSGPYSFATVLWTP